MTIKPELGGICAPQGFLAAGLHSGVAKKPGKKDLALIVSKTICSAAAVYTRNKVQAAPIQLTKANLEDGRAQAILCNSGNANACTANGEDVARRMCEAAANALGIPPRDVVVASTGVIGQPLDASLIESAIPALQGALSPQGCADAVAAIMTTDTRPKEVAVSFLLGGKVCKLGGIAKGSGMIHPDMATMLAFLTTDAAIETALLQKALDAAVEDSFNMISVDGDTSTNDMAVLLANGLAGNPSVQDEGADYHLFVEALTQVCGSLARMIAADGEGATKLLECVVTGAWDHQDARALAKSVIGSSLFKAAMFGGDANWGRILCALGYADARFDPRAVKVQLASSRGRVTVCEKGVAAPFSEEMAAQILSADEIEILVELSEGTGSGVAWGCDLTYDYVKINGDYRS